MVVGAWGRAGLCVLYIYADTHTKASTDLRLCLLTLFQVDGATHTHTYTEHSHTHRQTLHSIWQRRAGTTHDASDDDDDDVTQLKMPWRKLLNALAWRMENGECRIERKLSI